MGTPLPTDLDEDASITVVDEEHVLLVDRDVRFLRVPLGVPGPNAAPYEVEWEYPLPAGNSLQYSDPGMLWNGLVLLPYHNEV